GFHFGCLICVFTYLLFFFFQAEDGIRDRNVTGVQTCALPILCLFSSQTVLFLHKLFLPCHYITKIRIRICAFFTIHMRTSCFSRSEERRVGKESRCRWWTDGYKKIERRSRRW